MIDQRTKCETLAALHQGKDAWIIPNPWDVGSALDLERFGFKALATSSAAVAYTLGCKDGQVSLEDKLEHCRRLAAATTVPVSVDFEDGFSNEPDGVATNIALLAATGVAGCSIEDFSRKDQSIFDFQLAVARIEAAVSAVQGLDMPFQLVARADGLLRGETDLDVIVERLLAFENAGAHVLYAPGLSTLEQVKRVADSVNRPLNVLSPYLPGATVAELGAAGANRLSMGNALLGKLRGQFMAGVKEMLEAGQASQS